MQFDSIELIDSNGGMCIRSGGWLKLSCKDDCDIDFGDTML